MSISEKGEVAFWDSKWRNRQQSIPPSRRANPTEESLYNLNDTEKHIEKAVADGTLSKEVAAKAFEPRRVCRRLFGLSHAAMAGWSSVA